MVTVGVYYFEGKIASRGHHYYKETRDGKEIKVELETIQSSKKSRPEGYFQGWKTVGIIPREISRQICYFTKTEGVYVKEKVISTKLRPSPIPVGGLEILLLPKFSCSKQATFEKMIAFAEI